MAGQLAPGDVVPGGSVRKMLGIPESASGPTAAAAAADADPADATPGAEEAAMDTDTRVS